MSKRIIPTVLGAASLCFALVLGRSGLVDAWRGLRSTTWPTVTGTVLDAEIVLLRGGSVRRGRNSSEPTVLYEYEVNGERHRSDRIRFGPVRQTGSERQRKAREILEPYPPGTRVPVRYHPNRPSVAVLEPGLRGANFLRLGFSLVLAVLGGGLMVGVLRAGGGARSVGGRRRRSAGGQKDQEDLIRDAVTVVALLAAIGWFGFVFVMARSGAGEGSGQPSFQARGSAEPIPDSSSLWRPFTARVPGDFHLEGRLRGRAAPGPRWIDVRVEEGRLRVRPEMRAKPVTVLHAEAEIVRRRPRGSVTTGRGLPHRLDLTLEPGEWTPVPPMRFRVDRRRAPTLGTHFLVLSVVMPGADGQPGSWVPLWSSGGVLKER